MIYKEKKVGVLQVKRGSVTGESPFRASNLLE